jgi:nucleoside-diphosphate-sugar epimerase
VLILGGSGFIGGTLVSELKELSASQFEVVVTDRSNKYSKETNQIFWNVDIEHASFLDLIKKEEFDVIVDCAWVGLPSRSPHLAMRNFTRSVALYRAIQKQSKLIYIGIGSCLEYGESQGKVEEEAIGFNVPIFGQIKRELEKELINLGIRYTWVVPFFLFGKNQHKNSLINSTIENLQNPHHQWIINPNVQRDFVAVRDLVRLIIELIRNKEVCGRLNFGSGEGTQIIEFVNLARKLKGVHEYQIKLMKRDNECLKADMSKMNKIFPFFKLTPLSEALSEVIN